MLNTVFNKYSSNIVIETENSKITYLELKQRLLGLVEYFKKKKLKKGDKIAVLLPNCVEFVYCYLACMVGGYIIIPINHKINLKERNFFLSKLNPKLIIKKKTDLNFLKNKKDYIKNFNQNGLMGIFLTSGTTSTPKGICHNSRSLIENALCFNKHNKLGSSTRLYHLFPMSYMAGFLNSILCPMLSGGTIIIDGVFSSLTAINFWNTVKEKKINLIWASPTMIKAITDINKKKKIDQAIKIFVGTSSLSKNIKKNFYKKFKKNCLESYGMTEILIFSSTRPTDKIENYQNCGKVLSGNKIKKNRDLKNGNVRQLVVNTKFINKFYFSLEKKTFYKNRNSTYFDTGDQGYIDKKSNVVITGRSKDLIIKGGLNLNPTYIENKIINYKGLEELVILGIKDKIYGENILLCIKTVNNEKTSIKKLMSYLKKKLNEFEMPKVIIQVKSINKSAIGKLQRDKLSFNLLNKKESHSKVLYEKNN